MLNPERTPRIEGYYSQTRTHGRISECWKMLASTDILRQPISIVLKRSGNLLKELEKNLIYRSFLNLLFPL